MKKIVKRKNCTEDCVIVNVETGEEVESNAEASRIILEEITYDDKTKF